MKLRTYQATSMAEALVAVKRDLGRDAVILHTRTFRKGGFLGFGGRQMWEITASPNINIASPSPRARKAAAAMAPASRPRQSVSVIDGPAQLPEVGLYAPASSSVGQGVTESPSTGNDNGLGRQVQALTTMVETLLRRQDEHQPDMPEELFECYLGLLQQEVAEDIARDLVEKIRAECTGEQLKDRALIQARMSQFIARMIPTAEVAVERGQDRPLVIALIGPTGVGKTTTIAKLAADFRLRQKKRVGLITIDTYRIAAVEQLRTYAEIVRVPLKVVLRPDEIAEQIEAMNDMDVVLIDTAGRSQKDANRLTELQGFLAAARPDEVHLVLSTTASRRNVEDALSHFSPLGVDRVILTKLDEAVSFGMILNIVKQMNKSLSYVTTGQDVPDDIQQSHGEKIAEWILGGQIQC